MGICTRLVGSAVWADCSGTVKACRFCDPQCRGGLGGRSGPCPPGVPRHRILQNSEYCLGPGLHLQQIAHALYAPNSHGFEMLVMTRHYLARTWVSGLLVSAGLCGFLVLICRVFQQVTPSGTANPFARLMPKWIQTALNVDPSALSSIAGFLAVAWQHPFVLITLLGMGVAHASGLLAGGVENRTLALILARPVSRLRLVATAALVLEFWAAVAVLSMVAGSRFGFRLLQIENPPPDAQLAAVALNLWLLASAFGGIALAFSAFLSHRADAAGWGVTIVLIMYVWNFLAQLWTMAGSVPNFSLFHLFSPANIFLRAQVDSLHLFALGGVAAVAYGTAALIFRFRNFSV